MNSKEIAAHMASVERFHAKSQALQNSLDSDRTTTKRQAQASGISLSALRNLLKGRPARDQHGFVVAMPWPRSA